MIALNIKLWSWIIATIIFIGYNWFFNKEDNGGNWYSYDMNPLFRGGISAVLYLAFWVVWLIIFK